MCCRKLLVWFPRTYLDVEEVLDVEGDGRSVHGGIIVQTTVVRDVSPNGKRYRLCLKPHRGAMISRTCRGACDTDEERNTLSGRQEHRGRGALRKVGEWAKLLQLRQVPSSFITSRVHLIHVSSGCASVPCQVKHLSSTHSGGFALINPGLTE